MVKDRALSIARLREKRLKLRISQREITGRLGIARSQISSWETSCFLPSQKVLERYRKFLKECEAGRQTYTRLAEDSPKLEDLMSPCNYVSADEIEAVEAERQRLKISPYELSLKLKRDVRYWYYIRNGRRRLRKSMYIRVLEILKEARKDENLAKADK